MTKEKTDIEKQLSEKYNQITKLVSEYNKMAGRNKLNTRVGSIITPGEKDEEYDEEDDYESEYSTAGWMPSSLGC